MLMDEANKGSLSLFLHRSVGDLANTAPDFGGIEDCFRGGTEDSVESVCFIIPLEGKLSTCLTTIGFWYTDLYMLLCVVHLSFCQANRKSDQTKVEFVSFISQVKLIIGCAMSGSLVTFARSIFLSVMQKIVHGIE